jgi:hypothetical protein
MRFETGNSYAKGRPRGARNRLASRVLQDLLEVWDEPVTEGKPLTRGRAALRIMSRERPAEFAKLYASIMPREFWVDNLTDLADDELDRMMEALREQLRVAQEQPGLLALSAAKVIPHAH